MYRNKALGTQWILFQDYDELFLSTKHKSLPSLIDKNSESDAMMIGNYIGDVKICEENVPEKKWNICERYSRSSTPECRVKKIDPFLCTGWPGRRKHIDKVSSVYLTKVHKVLACKDEPCMINEIDARETWLDHYNGKPFNSSYSMCICK